VSQDGCQPCTLKYLLDAEIKITCESVQIWQGTYKYVSSMFGGMSQSVTDNGGFVLRRAANEGEHEDDYSRLRSHNPSSK
jgi:hypothetical protein